MNLSNVRDLVIIAAVTFVTVTSAVFVTDPVRVGQWLAIVQIERDTILGSYYEDIYTFAASVYVTVVDGQGFIELLQLTGNEYLEVNFGKVKNGPNANDQIFRVYKIGDRKPGGNHNTEVYTLHFCSEELMLSESIKLQKGAPDGGEEIHKTVTRILQTDLKIQKKLRK